MSGFRSLIGTKTFYHRVVFIAFPIILQSFIMEAVNLLDNLMIGQTGLYEMAGVSISNQLIFILNLSMFGAISGAEIFGAQFYGKKDYEGVAHSFWMKVYFALGITFLGILLFLFLNKSLISLWLHDENISALQQTFYNAKDYLLIMCIGLIPAGMTRAIISTLKECSRTDISLYSAIIALSANLVLDYALIFGKFGFPALGVKGAAIATVTARMLECAFVLIWISLNLEAVPYFKHIFSYMKVPKDLIKNIMLRSAPLMANELLWSFGIAFASSCYAFRGIEVVASMNILNTVANIFNTIFISIGSSIAIIVGQRLGSGEIEQALKEDNQMIFLAVVVGTITSACLYFSAGSLADFYNVDHSVKLLAVSLIQIKAMLSPIDAFNNAAYFTIRSGGKTWMTFMMDAGLTWIVINPVAFILSHFTLLSIQAVYFLTLLSELSKFVPEIIVLKKKSWAEDLTMSQKV